MKESATAGRDKRSSIAAKDNESGMALVVVVCFSAIGAILATGLLSVTTSQIKSTQRYLRHEQAFYIAEAGIEYAASVLNDTDDLDDVLANGIPSLTNVSFADGTFQITVTDNVDGDGNLFADTDYTVIIRSTGTFENVTRVIETVMTIPFFDVIPPNVDAALAFYGTNHTLTLIGSGGRIIGNDYDVPDDFNCSGANCWGPLTTNDDAFSSVYADSSLTVIGETLIEPAPPTPLTIGGGAYTESDWIDVVNQLIPLADLTITGVVSYAGSDQPIGTRTDPTITVVASGGELNISGGVDGAGVLILQEGGTFNASGNYHYEGLIIAFGDAAVEISGHGTPKISGAVIALGANADISLSGSGGFRYSSQALANLSNLGANTNTIFIISWREVK